MDEELRHLLGGRHVPLHVWPLHGGHHFTGDMQHQHKHKKQPTMRGRHFKTNSMSQYIGSGQKKRFDVRIKELVSKLQNPGGLLRKKRFLGSIFSFFFIFFLLRGYFAPIFVKFWPQC